MDFIAIDADETWKIFQQPQIAYSEFFEPSELKRPAYLKLAQISGCNDGPLNEGICFAEDSQNKKNATQSFGGSNGHEGTFEEYGQRPDQFDDATVNEGFDKENDKCKLEQNIEQERDQAAEGAANEIRGLYNLEDNPDNVELGSFVIRLDDRSIVYSTPTFGGNSGTISLDQILADARIEFGDINQSNIVGIVHLHPAESGPGFVNADNLSQLTALDFGSTYPSSRHTGGLVTNPFTGETFDPWDWASGERFLTADGHRTSVDDVSHYILGPDGVLREYDYSDPQPDSIGQPLQQRINEAETDAGGKC